MPQMPGFSCAPSCCPCPSYSCTAQPPPLRAREGKCSQRAEGAKWRRAADEEPDTHTQNSALTHCCFDGFVGLVLGDYLPLPPRARGQLNLRESSVAMFLLPKREQSFGATGQSVLAESSLSARGSWQVTIE